MANFEKVYPNIKLGEGDYGNSPQDPGNYCGGKIAGTNHGISAILYKSVIGRCPTANEMRNLSATKAKEIWKQYFWDKLDGDNVPLDSLAELYLYSTGGGKSGWLHIRQSANRVAGKKLFEVLFQFIPQYFADIWKSVLKGYRFALIYSYESSTQAILPNPIPSFPPS